MGLRLQAIAQQGSTTWPVLDKIASQEMESRRQWHAMAKNFQGPIQPYNITYNRCEWDVDHVTGFMQGRVTTHLSLPEGISSFFLDLADPMLVEQVTDENGQDILFQRGNGRIQFDNLPSRCTLVVRYSGTPVSTFFGSYKVSKRQPDLEPITATLSQPYGAKDWWPTRVDLFDKIDSIDIILTTLPTAQGIANGVKVNEEVLPDGKLRRHFKHRYPVAPYLISIAATNYVEFTDVIQLKDYSIPFTNAIYSSIPEVLPAALRTGLVMHFLDSLIGTYPFKEELYGHYMFDFAGGMEHQTNSGMGFFNDELIAHELAHQWFGDQVTCNTFNEIWLNEGFASFFQGYILSDPRFFNHPGNNRWIDFKRFIRNVVVTQPDGSVYVQDATDERRLFDYRLSYLKGAGVLNWLRNYIGDDAFFAACRHYLNKPETNMAFGTFADFKRSINAVTGLYADTNFVPMDKWIYGEGHPRFNLRYANFNNGLWTATVNQTPTHPSVSWYNTALQLGVVLTTGDTIYRTYQVEQQDQALRDFFPEGVDTVLIDPFVEIISDSNTVLQLPDLQQLNDQFDLLPNAATVGQSIRLQAPTFNPLQKVQVILHDAAGRQVLQIALSHDQALPHLPKGAYIATLSSTNFSKSQRIILY